MKYLVILMFLIGCVQTEKIVPEVVEPAQPEPEALPYTCPGTKMVGWKTPADMDAYDKQTFERAKVRCSQLYPESPCVKEFRETADKQYKVICGGLKNGTNHQSAVQPDALRPVDCSRRTLP